MQIHVYDHAQQVGQAAATLLAAQLISKPNSVLGLATGSTPIPTYQALISLYKAGVVDFSSASSFNLDEYVGLPAGHPCSYHSFMREQLFDHVNMPADHIHIPDGNAADPQTECARYDQAKNAVCRATEVITRHLAAGSFRLDRTEAAFGTEKGLPPIVLCLPNRREIMLRGRIDRIDRWDHEGTVYFRVIDYKSSEQALEAAKTWWGLQLQLLLYLEVCTASLPGSKPAGAFYFYVADPLVETATDAAEAVEGEMRKLFRLRGITLCDVEILEAMDKGEEAFVLPPVLQKSGELRKDAKALTLPQMKALMEHARQTAAALAQEMMDGKTDICPVRDGGQAYCNRCDYQSVCHFDPESAQAKVRELPNLSMQELRDLLEPGP